MSPTARRMLATLPDYYWDNDIIARILQARADEIDRIDGMIDRLQMGLIPGVGDDSLKLLAAWETIFGLPVAPAAASVAQRQAAIRIALKRLNAVTAHDVWELLNSELVAGFTVARDTPEPLMDTVTIHYEPGTFMAAVVERIVKRAWPAHRLLLTSYDAGFILDVSRLDQDTF